MKLVKDLLIGHWKYCLKDGCLQLLDLRMNFETYKKMERSCLICKKLLINYLIRLTTSDTIQNGMKTNLLNIQTLLLTS